MDEKRPKVRRNDVIHCENCGEDYASTYKRCPFCDEGQQRRPPGAHRPGGRIQQRYVPHAHPHHL